MTESLDIISAIEGYLLKKGKGEDYLAKKITQLFEGNDSPLNLESGVLSKLRDTLKDVDKNIKKVAKASEKFVDKLKNLQQTMMDFGKSLTLKPGTKFAFPNLTAFNLASEGLLKKVRLMRNSIHVSVLQKFFKTMRGLNLSLGKMDRLINKGLAPSGGTEAATRSGPLKVHLEGISSSVLSLLSSHLSSNVKVQTNVAPEKKEGSLIGSIIKGVIGTVALFAGIGWISKFLDETPMGRAIKQALGDLKDKAITFLTPYFKTIGDYMLEGFKSAFSWSWDFVKGAFNFYGLKEKLGKEFDGISVLLTKGIYYGVKKMAFGIVNKLSFGLFEKGAVKVYGAMGKIGTKLLGGGLLAKLLGGGLKQISKRIPLIGALISFKDAYDRIAKGDITGGLLSVASGIASCIPGVGTAISIGLDVLNAFLDSKSEGGTKSKAEGGLMNIAAMAIKVVSPLLKRVPFLGSLINLAEAYERFNHGDHLGGFLALGGAFANLFPGVGTAISIGIDALQMFLDTKNVGGETKRSQISNFVQGLSDKMVDGFKDYFATIFHIFSPINWGIDVWKWFKGKKDGLADSLKTSNETLPQPKNETRKSDTASAWQGMGAIPANDARSHGSRLIMPNNKDDIVMAKTGGPFDLAFKDMNQKLETLVAVFAEGVQLIARSNMQGSSSIVKAVVSTSGSKSAPAVSTGHDPISEFRLRAQRAIDASR